VVYGMMVMTMGETRLLSYCPTSFDSMDLFAVRDLAPPLLVDDSGICTLLDSYAL